MQYMGGKGMIAKELTDVILSKTNNRDLLIEPFIGGGWMTERLSKHFNRIRAYDTHQDLVLMWQGVLDGSWVPPQEVSRELYNQLRLSEPSPLRGFVGFGLSFGGKWFGGYTGGGSPSEIAAKKLLKPNQQLDYIGPARRGLLRKADAMRGVVLVERSDFSDIEIPNGTVVYCDPPYNNTTSYSVEFDQDVFWTKAATWARQADVFISELDAPPDWEVLWSREKLRTLKASSNNDAVVEKLFYRGPNS